MHASKSLHTISEHLQTDPNSRNLNEELCKKFNSSKRPNKLSAQMGTTFHADYTQIKSWNFHLDPREGIKNLTCG